MILGVSGKAQSGKDTVGRYLQYLLSEDSKRMSYSSWQLQIDRWYNHNDWQIKKFADKLKDIVCILIGCTRADLEDNDFKNKELGEEWNIPLTLDKGHGVGLRRTRENEEVTVYKPITPRIFLQLLGTEAGRQIIHPNIWCNALMKDYTGSGVINKQEEPIIKDSKVIYKVYNVEFPNWIITDCRFPNEVKAIEDKGGFIIRVERTNFQDGSDYAWGNESSNHESETALDGVKFHFTILNNGTLQDLYKSVDSIIHLIKKRL